MKRESIRLRLLAGFLSIWTAVACSGVATRSPTVSGVPEAQRNAEAEPEKATLRVALFPWIPDAAGDEFEALRDLIKSGFEAQYPDIDLELRLVKGDDSYYKPARLAGWLASGKYDLVEIDTVVLGDLIEAEVIEPWPSVPERSYLQAAQAGSVVYNEEGKSVWWGVPHLSCGFFLVSRSKALGEASSIEALVTAAKASGQPILGNFASSWDLPGLYLNARVDNGLDPVLELPLDAESTLAVKHLADLCGHGNKNPCVDGTFNEKWDAPVKRFVEGQAAGYWGYSERLHLTVSMMKSEGVGELRVSSIPLGDKVIPLLFTDAFVRRKGCTQDRVCSDAARMWAEFVTSDDALRDLLLSKDAGAGAVPRYLLPATQSVLKTAPLSTDHLYKELLPFALKGLAFPNTASLYERRRLLGYLLERELARE